MRTFKSLLSCLVLVSLLTFCENKQASDKPAEGAPAPALTGQSGVKDNASKKDIVKVAVGSKDHTTLVAAVKAAELVDALSNAGPFTVFAPVNAAFDKLPKGTVDELLKPENKEKLKAVLQHHVSVGVFKISILKDGMNLDMVDGTKAKITKKDGSTYIDAAKIIATVDASNGIIHVVDACVLPPAK
ncbi:MAG: fasciclin domain-containing protein [Candidatus Kapabacteria bacterium]|nr:fasciclin domain-containing protein [Candidatus Kapabacteria bacterium]